jgi:hypothetical protein
MAAPQQNIQIIQIQLSGEQWACGNFPLGQSTAPNWILNSLGGMSVNPSTTTVNPTLIRRTFSNFGPPATYTFKPEKTYQFITRVRNFYSQPNNAPLTISSPWLSSLTYNESQTDQAGSGNGVLFFYTNPTTPLSTSTLVRYNAPNTFGLGGVGLTECLDGVNIFETDWEIQGFAPWRRNPPGTTGTSSNSIPFLSPIHDSIGWCHYADTNSYVWFDSATASLGSKNPAGGGSVKSTSPGWRDRNALYKLVGFSKFNLSFTYQKLQGNPNDGISIYLSQTKPPTVPGSFSLADSTFIASLTYSTGSPATFSAFFGLDGNQYLVIVGEKTTSSGTGSIIALTDIKIDGGYHPGNNRQYLTTNSLIWQNPTTIGIIGLTGATYSAIVGQGNTVNATSSLSLSQINSKIGNGTFRAGIWENGVWNSGWRGDTGVYEFDSVDRYINYSEGIVWRFSVSGPTSSVTEFTIGDNVSIGNIVAIDINGERKLLKNYFTVIDKLPEDNPTSLVVEFNNTFPLRIVKKDSDLHRITVSKNIWLSGGFLNGYFKGIWNFGLFKGYPLITEMFDTHWIDGIFDGGHFKNTRLIGSFSSVFLDGVNRLGLSFSSPHNLRVGDLITIDKTNKLINLSYDGTASVVDVVDKWKIITSKIFGLSTTFSETGLVTTDLTTGVIQNFQFRSNNISRITSSKTTEADAVFVYNSWIDTYYPNTSAVNVLKSTTSLNRLSRRSFSENNLYGWPTYDVLSSDATFRDSFSLTENRYRLGTKWKIFNDYIGESSKFENYFGATGNDLSLFLAEGWTFSSSGTWSETTTFGPTGSSRILFYRSGDSGELDFVDRGSIRKTTGKELIVQAGQKGGILDIVSSNELEITNRSSVGIEKNRYSIVEFDLLGYGYTPIISTFGVVSTSNYQVYSSGPLTVYEPVLHFDNLNYTVRDVNINGVTYSGLLTESTYLPVSSNVNHLSTPNLKKIEYFFNKTNLSMTFRGNGNYQSENVIGTSKSTFIIDNLRFYEVDMIPFFKYFNDSTINRGIQIPYQGIAPFIDYSNSNFSFIDNISLGLSSIETTNSNVVVSGVGIGIGQQVTDSFFTINTESQTSANQIFISDNKLKENVTLVGKSNSGINIYEFNFIGKQGRFRGVIAQELIGTRWESAVDMKDSYLTVNYSMIDVKFSKIS